ncbi:ArgE/DapE family deacylase [Mycobacterium sp. NPDC051198]
MTEDMTSEKVLSWIEDSRGQLIDEVCGVVRVPSVNPNYPGVNYDDYVGYESEANLVLRDSFGSLFDESKLLWTEAKRENFVGVLRGRGKGRSLMLNGHVDVVPTGNTDLWTREPFSGDFDGARIYGRGSCDMKSGVVAALWAIKALQECGVRLDGDLILQSVAGEELGERGVGTGFVLDQGYTADAAIVLEPSSSFSGPLAINPSAAGLLWGKARVEGLAGHPGMRRELVRAGGVGSRAGVNAIDKGYLVLQALYRLEELWGQTKQRPYYPPGQFTILPGTIHGGSEGFDAPLMFSEFCEIDFLVWYPQDEEIGAVQREITDYVTRAVSVDPWLAGHPPQVTWPLSFKGYSTAVDHPIVQTLCGAHTAASGNPAAIEAFPAACDASWISQLGIPVVNYGPGHLIDAHRADESVSVDEIISAARTLALTAMQWCGHG